MSPMQRYIIFLMTNQVKYKDFLQCDNPEIFCNRNEYFSFKYPNIFCDHICVFKIGDNKTQ